MGDSTKVPDWPVPGAGSRRWQERVRDGIEALDDIDEFVRGVTYEEFAADQVRMRAVEREVSILGSAMAHVPEETRSRNPEVPWEQLIELRNAVRHEYWRPVPGMIWGMVIGKRRELRNVLVALLEDT